jgi:hypothetical protein
MGEAGTPVRSAIGGCHATSTNKANDYEDPEDCFLTV